MTLFQELLGELVEQIEGPSHRFEKYMDDPIGFARDVLQVAPWEKQNEMFLSFRDNKYTAVSAAPSTGKTFGAACLALWVFNCFPYSKTIVTAAPPERQIKDLLFGAIRMLQKRALRNGVELIGGQPKVMSIDAEEEEWWIHGFSIPTSGTREERIAKFHGHHGRGGTFAIIDEAHGVPPEILEAIDNCLTGSNTRLLMLFNPLAPSGIDYQATRDPNYNVITISAFDHPNVKSGEDLMPGMVDRDTIIERIDKWTRPVTPADVDSDRLMIEIPWMDEEARRVVVNPVFCYKVLGEFPWESESALIPLYLIDRAKRNYGIELEKLRAKGIEIPEDSPKPMCGLDMAEFGTDMCAFATRYDNFLAPIMRWGRTEELDSVDKAARMARMVDHNRVNVDAIGFTTIAPMLREHEIRAFGVKVSWSATRDVEEGQFVSLRDQLGWSIREWMYRRNSCMPPDEDLEADMSAFEYRNTRRGILISKKDHVRRMLVGRSPDGFDALSMTFYTGGEGGRAAYDSPTTFLLNKPLRASRPAAMRTRRSGRRRRPVRRRI